MNGSAALRTPLPILLQLSEATDMARTHTNVHAPVEHPALHVDNVSKTYGDAPALNPLSLDIAKGERVAHWPQRFR